MTRLDTSLKGDDGWQPIETAPNYAEHIWVYGGRRGKPEITISDGSFWRYEKLQGSKTIPTHWMKLEIPEAPKT